MHFTEHRCHVWQGRPDLDELRDGKENSNDAGQQGRLRSTAWFCLEALLSMGLKGAALDPHVTLLRTARHLHSEVQSYPAHWPSQQHGVCRLSSLRAGNCGSQPIDASVCRPKVLLVMWATPSVGFVRHMPVGRLPGLLAWARRFEATVSLQS